MLASPAKPVQGPERGEGSRRREDGKGRSGQLAETAQTGVSGVLAGGACAEKAIIFPLVNSSGLGVLLLPGIVLYLFFFFP